jgi:hypothetical protein
MNKLLSVLILALVIISTTQVQAQWLRPVGTLGAEVGSNDLVLPVRGGLAYTNDNGIVASGTFVYGSVWNINEKYKTSLCIISVGEAWGNPDIGWRFGLGLSPITTIWDTKPEDKWKGAKLFTMPYICVGLDNTEEWLVLFGFKVVGIYK